MSRRWGSEGLLLLCSLIASTTTGAQGTAPADRHAAIRRVNLNDTGSFWIGFAGQARERVESWTNFNFGALPAGPTSVKQSDTFALTRFLLSADLHAGRYVRLFAQGKGSLSTNRELPGGRRPSDVDEIDVQQLFAELRLLDRPAQQRTLTARAGRFELAFGRERLISNLEWANTKRSFEGAAIAYASRTTSITAFRTQPVGIRFYRPDIKDSSTLLYGAYATRRFRSTGIDGYWIGQRRDSGLFVWNGTPGHENRQTIGTRAWTPSQAGRLDWEGEIALQFGTIGAGSINASMAAAQIGYTMRQPRFAPRIYAGIDYASGDDASGGDVRTFSQLNPQTHLHLGFADIVARQNVIDVSGGVSGRVWRSVTAAADFHSLRRASDGDAYYAKNGSVSRPATAGSSKSIASEIDFTLRWPVDRYLSASGGWSHVMPGAFIKQAGATAGADRRTDFVYVMLQYTL